MYWIIALLIGILIGVALTMAYIVLCVVALASEDKGKF